MSEPASIAPSDLRSPLPAPVPGSAWEARASRLRLGWRAFVRSPTAVLGLALLMALLVVSLGAPWLAAHDPYAQDLAGRLQAPSPAHWLGTDELGRDIWARLAHGSRVTLLIVALVTLIVGPLGLTIGTIAGYAGGWVDAVLMRITDIALAFPRLVLALAMVAALGPGIENAVIAIALTAWPPYARLARAETLGLRRSDVIAAAVVQGASHARIVRVYVMPLCLPSVLVRLTLDMAGTITIAAGLGFLGLGAQPPLPEWGAMIATGRNFVLDQWWVAAMPGAAILVTALGFNLVGDGLRDMLDPRRRS